MNRKKKNVTSTIILHNLVHPGENIKYLIVHSEFLNFTSMSFDITPVILPSPCCTVVSRRDHDLIRGNFPPKY